ncbi:hypothetical protein AGMMS49949_00220 [Alphaproteobacteria bacterium]|nr:hypothetical protein AGMMS49949_00220 [Alphaproteobacteria bacterium]GHS97347.1 hypothetical protein AGMMS50296_4260 [Alphaproteobacteria bacterium]
MLPSLTAFNIMAKKILIIFVMFPALALGRNYQDVFTQNLAAQRQLAPPEAWFQEGRTLGDGTQSTPSIEVFREISNPNHRPGKHEFLDIRHKPEHRNYILLELVADEIWTQIENGETPNLKDVIKKVLERLKAKVKNNATQKTKVDAAASDIEIYGNVLGFSEERIRALRKEFLHLGTETTEEKLQEEKTLRQESSQLSRKTKEELEQEDKDNQKRLKDEAKETLERMFEGTSPGNHGLINLGTTCYINACLEVLHSITQFRQPILDMKIGRGFEDTDTYRNARNNFIRKTQTLFREKSGRGASETTIRAFLDSLEPFGFKHEGQADTKEFFENFLIALDQALPKAVYNSAVSNVLVGAEATDTSCPNCKKISSRYDLAPVTMLTVKESPKQCLEQCLEQYTAPGELDDKNLYKCSGCQRDVAATKQTKFLSLPAVLWIHLKRYNYELVQDPTTKEFEWKKKKLPGKVSFPDKLDMSHYVKDTMGTQQMYQIIAVIIHWGSIKSGHYYAYVLDTQSGLWYKKDNNSSNPSPNPPDMYRSTEAGKPSSENSQSDTGEDASSVTPYILVYGRIDPESENDPKP